MTYYACLNNTILCFCDIGGLLIRGVPENEIIEVEANSSFEGTQKANKLIEDYKIKSGAREQTDAVKPTTGQTYIKL